MLSALRERGVRWAEARLPALTRLKAPEPLPIVLHRRRIYVLPTGFGLFFAVLVGALLLGALNYNNNPALLVGFLVASAAHTGLLLGFLDLRGLRLVAVRGDPVHAGDSATLSLHFEADGRVRRGLRLQAGMQQARLDVQGRGTATLRLPATKRGWLRPGRLRLSTIRPHGLFTVWSWLHPEAAVLVYPALDPLPVPLPGVGGRDGQRGRREPDGEPHSLRDYRGGDPLHLVAWKRSAQAGRLLLREYETPQRGDPVLDWSALGHLEPEHRIRRLARWVLDAERLDLRSTLVIPGHRIGPARGHDHVHACLRALALLPEGLP